MNAGPIHGMSLRRLDGVRRAYIGRDRMFNTRPARRLRRAAACRRAVAEYGERLAEGPARKIRSAYCSAANILAHASAMARSGELMPGNVAQPPFSMKLSCICRIGGNLHEAPFARYVSERERNGHPDGFRQKVELRARSLCAGASVVSTMRSSTNEICIELTTYGLKEVISI